MIKRLITKRYEEAYTYKIESGIYRFKNLKNEQNNYYYNYLRFRSDIWCSNSRSMEC